MSKFFVITVEDSGDVYATLESFKFEVETMTELYGLPADVVRIEQIDGLEFEAGKEGSSPPGSSHLELDTDHYAHVEFHDVAGANIG